MNNKRSEQSISIQEMELKSLRLNEILAFLKLVAFYLFWAYFCHELFLCISSLAANNPEAINALTGFVKVLSLDKVLLSLAAVSSAVWGLKERKQKKRLVAMVGSMRRQLESNDAYAPSSGLDKHGHAEDD